MKNICFIRHGQTNSSLNNRLCGSRTDETLNENGFQQIKRLILFLKNNNPDSIYTSPLIRAKQSAKIISDYFNLNVNEIEDLKEIDFGDWEGLTFIEIKSNFNEKYLKWMNSPDDFTPINGESIKDLCSRLKDVMELILKTDHDTIFLITHGGPIRAALINSFKIPLSFYWNISIPHGSATCLELKDNSIKLLYMGQIVL